MFIQLKEDVSKPNKHRNVNMAPKRKFKGYANKFVEDFFSSQFMIESNMKSFHKVQCTGGILCIAETTLCQGFEFSEKSSNLQLASATQKYCFYSRSMAIKP